MPKCTTNNFAIGTGAFLENTNARHAGALLPRSQEACSLTASPLHPSLTVSLGTRSELRAPPRSLLFSRRR